MNHPVHLILSPGTRIVTRNDANRIGGQAGPAPNSAGALIPSGAVGVIVQSPADAQHAYKVRFNNGDEAMLRRNEFSILKEFKNVPERGCVADQPQQIRMCCGWLSAQLRSRKVASLRRRFLTSDPVAFRPIESDIGISNQWHDEGKL